MKNTLKFMFVALVMTAMVSCGGGKTDTTAQDSVTTEVAPPAPAQDSTTQDSTKAAQ